MAIRPDSVKRPSNLRVRRFIAKYVMYLEVLGYLFVVLIGSTIAALWLIHIDDVAKGATSSPTPQLKPFEENVSWPKECAVLELLVEDEPAADESEAADESDAAEEDDGDKRQSVRKGDPLVRITDDPAWVEKFKDAETWQTVVDNLDAAEDIQALSTSLASARAEAQAKLDAWEQEKTQAPSKTIRAPMSGMLDGAKKSDIEGEVYAGEAKLFSLVDFSDLRIRVKVTGANIVHGRLLQEAKVKIKDNYGEGEIIRVDLKEKGRWGRRRVEFFDPSDGAVNQYLTELFQDKDLTIKRDIGFDLQQVTNVEILSRNRAETLKELPTDRHDVADAEQFHDKEYRAVMILGYHHAKVKLTRFSDEERETMVGMVEPSLVGKGAEVTDPDTEEVHRYRLAKLRAPKFLVTMVLRRHKAGEGTTKEIAKRLKQEGAVLTDQLERFYLGTLRVLDPPEALQQKVRELWLADPRKFLTAEVEWIVDKRRIAMLLFRQ